MRPGDQLMELPDCLRPAARSARVGRLLSLIAPKSDGQLEAMAQAAHAETLRHFGRTIRLFAPLYLSNECINSCQYCGFSRENPILRVTLGVEEVLRETRHLASEGFRSILLVAGEHPKFVSNGYLEEAVSRVAAEVPSVSLEVGPMEAEEYRPLVAAGAEGLVVYQETYHRPTYEAMHLSGPKRDYLSRLACPERAHAAGFRRIGVGALLGLWDWRDEAYALAAHIEHLLRVCWRAQLTVSFPRLRPAAGGFAPPHPVGDRELVQLICALRIVFPEIGIVLSTRESGALRDALVPLGVTLLSAGSHTEPGGYTGQGREALHRTVRGRAVAAGDLPGGASATEQFVIADGRSAAEVAAMLKSKGYEPVWKDWDRSILAA
jgi:2-iminoacetate synthase